MITENLSTLKIHKLTQAQYDRELQAGNIDNNALYLTPDDRNYTDIEIDTKLEGKVNSSDFESHISDVSNPHNVTAEQTGALPLTGGTLRGDLTIRYDDDDDETVITPSCVNTPDIVADYVNVNSVITVLSDNGDLDESPVFGSDDVDTQIYAKGLRVENNDVGAIYNLYFPAKTGTFALTSDIPMDYETKTDASSKLTEAKTYSDTNLSTAKSYTDTVISNLINSAPTTLDTLGEIATAMENNADVVEALESAIGTKANATHSHAISDVSGLQSALDGKVGSLSDLGITATATELNYVDGVTSNIQTQLDSIEQLAGENQSEIGIINTKIDAKADTTYVDAEVAKITNGTIVIPKAEHATSADEATQDGSGNVITDTYATKDELEQYVDEQITEIHTDTLPNYATKDELADKYVAKEDGKDLSSNDYTDIDKEKVDNTLYPVEFNDVIGTLLNAATYAQNNNLPSLYFTVKQSGAGLFSNQVEGYLSSAYTSNVINFAAASCYIKDYGKNIQYKFSAAGGIFNINSNPSSIAYTTSPIYDYVKTINLGTTNIDDALAKIISDYQNQSGFYVTYDDEISSDCQALINYCYEDSSYSYATLYKYDNIVRMTWDGAEWLLDTSLSQTAGDARNAFKSASVSGNTLTFTKNNNSTQSVTLPEPDMSDYATITYVDTAIDDVQTSLTYYPHLPASAAFNSGGIVTGSTAGGSGYYISTTGKTFESSLTDDDTKVPTSSAVKAYVDESVGDCLPLSGGNMTGNISLGTAKLTPSSSSGLYITSDNATHLTIKHTGQGYTNNYNFPKCSSNNGSVALASVDYVDEAVAGVENATVDYITTGAKSGTIVGDCATAEGYDTIASGDSSHAEGYETTASNDAAHAEGYSTTASGMYSHAEGSNTKATAEDSHAEGYYTEANGDTSHAEGNGTIASGTNSHAEGFYTTASGDTSHAEGYNTIASSDYSHAEGYNTTVTNDATITAQLTTSTTAGHYGHAEGYGTVSYGTASHAEGNGTTASGIYSHAEGRNTTASGQTSHAEGGGTTASGLYSHAEGSGTIASGTTSHAGGMGTIANDYQYVIGRFNADTTAPTSISDKTATSGLFIVGIGTSDHDRSNGFRVTPSGKVYGTGTFGTSGADYAEYFEWFDGNPDNEDRRGRFVTLEGDKIRYATANDDYILGVVSANPSVVGDVHSEDWHNRYLKDVFGSKIVEVVEIEETTNENGEVIPAHIERRWVLNPDYDPNAKYVSREERPEWAAIGIVGKLVVVDDGTCQVNGYCYPNANGIATASQGKTNYRVMERLDDTHIRIFIK